MTETMLHNKYAVPILKYTRKIVLQLKYIYKRKHLKLH